ncbi:fukutin, partial [Brachionus plicatilis]
ACLFDIKVLSNIKGRYPNQNKLKDLLEIQDLNRPFILSMAIEIKFMSNFFKELASSNLPCNIVPTQNHDLNATIPASIYIVCGHFIYQISVMYPRGDFYWIPRDDFVIKKLSKSLGDYNRAFEKFETIVVEYGSENVIIPFNIDFFLNEYKRSKFIECKSRSSYINFNKLTYDVKDIVFDYRLGHLKRLFQLNQIEYWLTGKTLLNWYRECGLSKCKRAFIGLYSKQLNLKIENFKNRDNFFRIDLKRNINNKMFESIIGEENMFHFCLTSEFNRTHMNFEHFINGKVERKIIRKINQMCSAEILEKKYTIPCNPESVLIEIFDGVK